MKRQHAMGRKILGGSFFLLLGMSASLVLTPMSVRAEETTDTAQETAAAAQAAETPETAAEALVQPGTETGAEAEDAAAAEAAEADADTEPTADTTDNSAEAEETGAAGAAEEADAEEETSAEADAAETEEAASEVEEAEGSEETDEAANAVLAAPRMLMAARASAVTAEEEEEEEIVEAECLTVLDGVDYSAVYNYYYYRAKYPEVIAACGDDEEATLRYFVENGMAADQQAISTFDPDSYRRGYSDLRRAFGDEYAKYYLHYIKFGVKEKRARTTGLTEVYDPVTVQGGVNYAAVYDFKYYRANNDEAAAFGEDDIATLAYFVACGMANEEQAIETFDEVSYRRGYCDLRRAYGDEYEKYYLHYIRFGKKEGRTRTTNLSEIYDPVTKQDGVNYAAVYDFKYYQANNKKAASFGEDDIATLAYFVKYGMADEDRAIESFDEVSYRRGYCDLRRAFGSNYAKYYLHYINHGKKEGRTRTTNLSEIYDPVTVQDGVNYAAVYDFKYYQANYKKAASFGEDDIATLAYFVKTGMKNQHQASSSFDPVSYRLRYQDLRVAYEDNYPSYYLHYIRWGQKEKRATTGTTTLQNPLTKYNGKEYSSEYDYFYYIEQYPSVYERYGDNDVATLRYYVKTGKAAGHLASAAAKAAAEEAAANTALSGSRDLETLLELALCPDLSHYKLPTGSNNVAADWDWLESNCAFLISKATQGTTYVDTALDTFITECEKRCIPYWLYSFLNYGDELAQAKFLVSTCSSKVGKYFQGYVLDVEKDNEADSVAEALEYISTQSKRTMLYTTISAYKTKAWKTLIDNRADTCAWWEPRYGKNDGSVPDTTKYPYDDGVDLWQYTSAGAITGITNKYSGDQLKVDLNKVVSKTKSIKWFMGLE